MKQTYASSWKSSVQPRKQRKRVYNAPAHIRTSFLASHLSKELKEKHKMRSLPLRKGDRVKVTRGQFAGTIGKVERVDRKDIRVFVEGAEILKSDGSKRLYAIHPSSVTIIELVTSDKRRIRKK